MEKRNERVWVVVAAFNEARVIGNVLRDLNQYPYQVVVVDDGSSDGTDKVALEHAVTVLVHGVNLGQGAALQTGITFALRAGAEYIVTFDADGQHCAEEIEKMLERCEKGGYAVALGTRFGEGGAAVNITWRKNLALRIAIVMTRWMTGLKVTDTHNGLRVFSRYAAEQIRITQNGMAHASEILSQIAARRLSYIEVPVTITYTEYSRKKGQSLWNGVNILWELLTGRMK